MKKTYKNPTLMVVNVKAPHILAGSVKDIYGAEGLMPGQEWTGEGVAGGRAGRFVDDWDEDWEEDY